MADTFFQLFNFYFKEEMVVDILNRKYGSEHTRKEIYTGHSFSLLPEYRKIEGQNIKVEEFTRHIQITWQFSPLFQDMVIAANKDNHMLNRVYIKADYEDIGPWFYIDDDKVTKLLQMPRSLISQLEERSEWYRKATERIEEYRAPLEVEIESFPFNWAIIRTLFATSQDFMLKTTKGPKRRDYHIPVTDYETVLNNMFEDAEKFFREKDV